MNKGSWLKGYSILFLMVIFIILLGQLFVSGITIRSISDKYLWRKSLVEKFNNFKYNIGDRVFSNVLVGEDGWLYYTGDKSIQDYQKTSPINKNSMKRLTSILEQFDEKVQQYGGELLVVIPPDKSTVYPQYMPDEVPVIGQVSSLDRFLEHIQNNSNIQILDLRPALTNASEIAPSYYTTDTHWNCIGAYYAYNDIISKLKMSNLELDAYSLSDFELDDSQSSVMDMPSMLALNLKEEKNDVSPKFKTDFSVITGHNDLVDGKSPRVVVNQGKKAPSLMVFHDSFYEVCLNKFIEPTFGRTVSIPYRVSEMTDYLNIIDAEKPDILIVEFAERLMEYFMWHLIE